VVNDHPQVTPRTVEFDVHHEETGKLGSLETWALPNHGDHVMVYSQADPDSRAFEVVRCEFEPDNILVVVRDV
jgi:hypothetical protein